MTKTPESPEPNVPPLSSAARLVGIVTLVVSIAGILSQAIIGGIVWGNNELALAYARGWGFKISVGLAIANLLVCIVHYHKTAMRLDVLTRVLNYVWILATCVFLVVWKENLPVN